MEWKIWFAITCLVSGAAFRCNADGVKTNYRACFVNRPCEIQCRSDNSTDPTGGMLTINYTYTDLNRATHRDHVTDRVTWAIATFGAFVLNHNEFQVLSSGSLIYKRATEISQLEEFAFLAMCTNRSSGALVAVHEIWVLDEPAFVLSFKPQIGDWETFNPAETLKFDLEHRPVLSCSVVSINWSVSYWEKDGERLKTDINGRLQVKQTKQSLVADWYRAYSSFINEVTTMGLIPEDTGQYRCVVDYGKLVARSDPLNLTVEQPPENSEPRNLTIRYHAESAVMVTVHWQRPEDNQLNILGYGVTLMGNAIPYTTFPKFNPAMRYRKIEDHRIRPGTWYIVSVISYYRDPSSSVKIGKRAEVRFKTLEVNELKSYKESPLEKQLRESELMEPDEDRIQNSRVIGNVNDWIRDAATSSSATSPLTTSRYTPAQSLITVDETFVLMIALPCIIVFFAMLTIIVVLVIRIKYPKKSPVSERRNDEEDSCSVIEETRVEMISVAHESVEPVRGAGLYPLLPSPVNDA